MSIQALRDNLAHAREEKYEFVIGLKSDEVEAALAEFEAQLAEANARADGLLADLKTTWRLAKETETQRDAAEADARRLRAALEEYPEWLNERDEDGEITGTQYCLICNETELHGHKSDCLRVLALQAAAVQPDCGHPFRVGDVCPTCVAADAESAVKE